MKNVTVRQAILNVARYPEPVTDEAIQTPVHELVCRILFDIANRPDASVRGSMGRANKARKMIAERMDGKRRAGTAPATRAETAISFVDLTGGELGAAQEPAEAQA